MQTAKTETSAMAAVFQAAGSVTNDALIVVTPTDRIITANEKACEQLEYTYDELLQLPFADLIPDALAATWTKQHERVHCDGKHEFPLQCVTKNRQLIDVDVTATHLDLDGNAYCCLSLRETTNGQQSDRIARLQQDILARIASTSGELNETLNELCRLVEEMVPQAIASIMTVDPADGCLRFEAGQIHQELREAFEPLQPGEAAGSCGSAAFFKTPIIVEDTRQSQYWKSLQHLVKRYNLQACWSLPIMDERDQVLGTFAISHQRNIKPSDYQYKILETASHLASIAMRRQRSEEQLRIAHEEMAHISRLNTMGQMASSFAHELNQPLAAIVNYAFVLEKTVERDSDLTELRVHSQNIREQAMRAGEIVTSVRNMAKRTTNARKPVSPNALVNKVLVMLGHELRSMGVAIQKDLYEAVPEIEVDEVQIQQILVNLVRNAMDAMRDTPRAERNLTIVTELDSSQNVILRVTDAGPGLPQEELEAAFEPFHTTKPDGMGMGLAICRSIAESHAGELIAVSSDRDGAIFQLTLPIDSGAAA